MVLHNPYRKYDQGMDDAYMGKEPQDNSAQYIEGYERSLQLDDDFEDEKEFTSCSRCDGHPACEDFGCAIELGLGRMVKKDRSKDWDL